MAFITNATPMPTPAPTKAPTGPANAPSLAPILALAKAELAAAPAVLATDTVVYAIAASATASVNTRFAPTSLLMFSYALNATSKPIPTCARYLP